MKTLSISPEVAAVIKASLITETKLVLPSAPRLAPALYKEVNKVIEAAGGTWNRGQQAHLFTSDPRERLATAVQTRVLNLDLAVAAPKLQAAAKKKELQAFYTPASLAARVVALADVSGKKVLEPSAGGGALVQEAFAQGADQVVAVEVDTEAFMSLGKVDVPPMNKPGVRFASYEADFLTLDRLSLPEVDRVVMNPPFAKGQDIKHVAHAYQFLKPGGRLVAIMSPMAITKPAFARSFPKGLGPTKIEPVPSGAFSESGTNTATVIIVIDKPAA